MTATLLREQSSDGSPSLVARGIEKRYGATHALKGASLTMHAGTIHALVGQNGAGKSTFLGTIAGRVVPTSGEMTVLGQRHHFGDPRHARRAGIAAIYQELTIAPALSACANVFLGQVLSRAGFLDNTGMDRRFRELCDLLDVRIPVGAIAGRLSVADQQMLEIMRGIQSDARVLLFDEPTTALAPPERDALFRVMRQLRDEGRTLVLVSHNLEEVLDISDTITVFRNGEIISSAPGPEWTKETMVRAMIGRDLIPETTRPVRKGEVGEAPVIIARNITLPGAISDISLEIRRGEILGVGGLVGSGRSTLLRSLAGLEPYSSGELIMHGEAREWPSSVRSALAAGIALVPEDRKHQGLVLGLSGAENIALTNYRKASRFGFTSPATMQMRTQDSAQGFGFAPERLMTPVRNLSGGNQQKILLSKWHYRPQDVLMIDEPTRGIDIGAKEEILVTLRQMADRGAAIIVVSSELEEVCAVSDRVIVLSEGRKVAELGGDGVPVRVDQILSAAFRVGNNKHDNAHVDQI